MRLKLQTASLRETTAIEYSQRFVFGGLVTVAATLIAEKWGPVIGGLFLAFPGILPAGVSLVEKHKARREADSGEVGTTSARREASVEATGASLGAWGLGAFGWIVWKEAVSHPLPTVLALAGSSWLVVSWVAWVAREKRLR